MQSILTVFISLTFLFSCSTESSLKDQSNSKTKSATHKETYDSSCEWCGANEAPEDISWKTTIADENEPGERIIISGTVYQEDGTTPAPDVVVYVYHTNSQGKYPKRGDESFNAKRHGYLRGWMKTNEKGQYQFESIRPAAYQSHGGEPAHIHYVVKPPNKKEYWLDALVFKDDPRLNDEFSSNVQRDGGFGNITGLIPNENGVYVGNRDIVLANY